MTPDEVKDLMRTSTTEQEWNDNCDVVKSRCGGDYPSFWFATINMSGFMAQVTGAFV